MHDVALEMLLLQRILKIWDPELDMHSAHAYPDATAEALVFPVGEGAVCRSGALVALHYGGSWLLGRSGRLVSWCRCTGATELQPPALDRPVRVSLAARDQTLVAWPAKRLWLVGLGMLGQLV